MRSSCPVLVRPLESRRQPTPLPAGVGLMGLERSWSPELVSTSQPAFPPACPVQHPSSQRCCIVSPGRQIFRHQSRAFPALIGLPFQRRPCLALAQPMVTVLQLSGTFTVCMFLSVSSRCSDCSPYSHCKDDGEASSCECLPGYRKTAQGTCMSEETCTLLFVTSPFSDNIVVVEEIK